MQPGLQFRDMSKTVVIKKNETKFQFTITEDPAIVMDNFRVVHLLTSANQFLSVRRQIEASNGTIKF